MQAAAPDTWSWRDLPVLAEVVRGVDAQPGTGITGAMVAAAIGLTEDDVTRAALALANDGLVQETHRAAGGTQMPSVRFLGVSGDARRLVGAWPTPETAAERVVAALQSIVDNTDELEDTRTRARRVLDNLGGAGRDLGLAVAAAVITGQIPTAGS